MKIYVIALSIVYEGDFIWDRAFMDEKDAQIYCDTKNSEMPEYRQKHEQYNYQEIELS